MRRLACSLLLCSSSCGSEGSVQDDLGAVSGAGEASTAGGNGGSSGGGATEEPSTANQPGAGCTAVRREALQQVNEVSAGEVDVIERSGDTVRLFVNGSAGGFNVAATQPYVYVNLAGATKVVVTDIEADGSLDWDLAIKRQVIRTNGGDSGPGEGGAGYLEGARFDEVTAADVSRAAPSADDFIDETDCTLIAGQVGEVVTPFSAWYDYESETMVLTPHPGVFVLRGADGETHYKLEIESYYSMPDGSTGPASAFYALRYAPL